MSTRPPYRARPLYVRAGIVIVVEMPLAGIQLTDLLAREMPDHHRLDLRQLLRAGSVHVNGEACTANRRLRANDVVQVFAEAAPRTVATAQADARPAVLYESASALVICKPAGVTTVPDRERTDLGVHGLLHDLRPADDLRIVHRLDRDTSGCLLLAKGLAAARHFDVQFRERAVEKTYTALVHGVPARDEFQIDAWLGPDRRRPGKVVASARELTGFREAHTAVAVRERFRSHALVALSPTTGRGHQLRVHLQSAGHPIVADRDYGGEELLLSAIKPGYKLRPGVAERPLLQRMFLHAERIEFRDLDGRDVTVDAALPEDLEMPLRRLRAFHERGRRP